MRWRVSCFGHSPGKQKSRRCGNFTTQTVKFRVYAATRRTESLDRFMSKMDGGRFLPDGSVGRVTGLTFSGVVSSNPSGGHLSPWVGD